MAAGSVTVPPSYLPSQQNSLNAMMGWLTGRVGETMGNYPGYQSVYPSTQMNQGLGALSQYMQPSQQQNSMQGLANRATQFGQGMQPYWSNPQVVQDYYQKNVVDPSQYALYENTLPQIRAQFAAPGSPGYSSSFQQQATTDAITQSQIANNQQLAQLMYNERARDIQGEQAAWDRGQQGFTQQNQLRNIPLEQATAGIQLGQAPMDWQYKNQMAQGDELNKLLATLMQGSTAPMNQGYTAEGADPWMQTAGAGANLLGSLLGGGQSSVLGSLLGNLFPSLFGKGTTPTPTGQQSGGGGGGMNIPGGGNALNVQDLWNYFNSGDQNLTGGDIPLQSGYNLDEFLRQNGGGGTSDWLSQDWGGAGDWGLGGGLDVSPFTQTGGVDLAGEAAGWGYDVGEGLFSSAGDLVNLGGDVTSSVADAASGSIPWLGLAKSLYGGLTNGWESLVSPSLVSTVAATTAALTGMAATGVGAIPALAAALMIGYGKANFGGTGYSINPFEESNRGLLVDGAGGQPGVPMESEQQFANMIDSKALVERFKTQFGFDPSTMASNDKRMRGVVAWVERQPEVKQAQQGYQSWLGENYQWQTQSSEGEQGKYILKGSQPNWFDPNYQEVGGGA